jgi:hypothetical protein
LTKLKRYSIYERKSKVSVKNLAECYRRGSSFADFLGTIPPAARTPGRRDSGNEDRR